MNGQKVLVRMKVKVNPLKTVTVTRKEIDEEITKVRKIMEKHYGGKTETPQGYCPVIVYTPQFKHIGFSFRWCEEGLGKCTMEDGGFSQPTVPTLMVAKINSEGKVNYRPAGVTNCGGYHIVIK